MDMTFNDLLFDEHDNSLAYECLLTNDYSIIDAAYEAADDNMKQNLAKNTASWGEKASNWLKEQAALLGDKLATAYEEKMSNAFRKNLTTEQATEIKNITMQCFNEFSSSLEKLCGSKGRDVINTAMNAAESMSDNNNTSNANVQNTNADKETPSLGDKPPSSNPNAASNTDNAKEAAADVEESSDKADSEIQASAGGNVDEFVTGVTNSVAELRKSYNEKKDAFQEKWKKAGPQKPVDADEANVVNNLKTTFGTMRNAFSRMQQYFKYYSDMIASLSKKTQNVASKGSAANQKKMSFLMKIQKGLAVQLKGIQMFIDIVVLPFNLIFFSSKLNKGENTNATDGNDAAKVKEDNNTVIEA